MLVILEAHKLIFALHSDHFKNAFYGSGTAFKESEEGVVVVKETTKEAFEDFVVFNYEKRIEFEKKSLAELFEILNLAERYQVRELKEKVVDYIKEFPLSMDNVIKVASTASSFSQFMEVSQALYANCVTFLGKQFSSVQAVLSFVRSSQDESTVVRLLKDINIEDGKCTNCQQHPCHDGSSILRSDFLVAGMRIKAKGSWRPSYVGQLCKVINSSGGSVTVTPADAVVCDPYTIYITGHRGPMFEYSCDK